MYSRIALVALLAACTACSHPKTPKGCAEVHFTLDSSSNSFLHIGVTGDKRISNSACFRIMTEDRLLGGYQINVTNDLESPFKGKVAESFVASIPSGNYVLYVPESWLSGDQSASIVFSTDSMPHSVGVFPEFFKGTEPARVNLMIESP